jgi:DNA-binding SARP family transcriptional activator
VVCGVGMLVESVPLTPSEAGSVEIRMLGPLQVLRDGASCALPASRKARGLLAYLALAPRPVPRSQLCELLWDVPNDPRGELRWCLSKIRSVVDAPGRRRVATHGDTIALDLGDCFVDALQVVGTSQALDTIDAERLRALDASFGGELLEGLEIDRSPAFTGWLTAQRRRFRGLHIAVLERLAADAADDDALGYLDRWLALAPFDRRVHELMLNVLARSNRIHEGDEHVAAAVQSFEAEGLDGDPLRVAWRATRSQTERSANASGVAASVEAVADRQPADRAQGAESRRASVAVMPFVDLSSATAIRGGPADGLVYDVISRLAKLRSLFVIAQGTVFALHERGFGAEEAARMLNVDYVAGGSVRRSADRLSVSVELAETRTSRIIWAETFNHTPDDAFAVLDEIGNRIVASIANEIELSERNRAVLKPPNSLDAWEAHHRGLWHMYRFNQPDNEQARYFFEMAVRLDPTFARAHAGLSFTHFQNAFQGWTVREPEIERAYASAGQSLMADDRDPAAHWAMGRALWLRGRHDESVVELERVVDLSPNFAMGHYTLAFVHSQSGDPETAISASDYSRQLSPFDPLLFGMLGARSMALVRLGRFEEAAEFGVKAAARPNAHAHILAIAAFSLALAGRVDEGRTYGAAIRRTLPNYRVDDFLTAMHFTSDGESIYRNAATRIAMT